MSYFLILFCIFLFLYLFIHVKYFSKNATDPPFISGRLPIIGHLHRILFNNMFHLVQEFSAECAKNGGVSMLDLGIRKVCVVTDPQDCLTISNTCLEKDPIYSISKSLLGKGILIADVPTWKKHRKLLSPAFSQPVLNGFVATFNNQARVLVKLFGEELGHPFSHEHLLRLNNLETICLTSTGNSNSQEYGDHQRQYVALMDKVLNLFTKRVQQFWLQSDFIFNLTKMKKEEDETINTMRKLSNQIIKTKRTEIRNNKKTSISDFQTQNISGNMKPFMDLILELADDTGCFTDQEIKEETDTIIVAGHETTASTLTFVFTLLGSHPDVQQKVYNEVLNVFGDIDKDLDKDDLSKLTYTDAVLKEVVRLYPVLAVNGRYSDKPVKLKNYTIEANTGYFLMLYAVNRDPMWGPDADLFRPERWLEAETLPDLNYFGGYGLGRRGCIGKAYAIMSMKVAVAHVVRRYRISADVTKMVLMWDIITRPHGSGHQITLQLR